MVVKEVSELIKKSAAKMSTSPASAASPASTAAEDASEEPNKRLPLVQSVAWLITNSMRSEMLQYLQLQMQMVTNLFRKSAFRTLLHSDRPRQQDTTSVAMLT